MLEVMEWQVKQGGRERGREKERKKRGKENDLVEFFIRLKIKIENERKKNGKDLSAKIQTKQKNKKTKY